MKSVDKSVRPKYGVQRKKSKRRRGGRLKQGKSSGLVETQTRRVGGLISSRRTPSIAFSSFIQVLVA